VGKVVPQVNLYRISNAHEKSLEVELVLDFSRDDLYGAPLAILDTVNEIYVWVGTSTSDEARDLAFAVGEKYLKV
jgi:hypothetical protein